MEMRINFSSSPYLIQEPRHRSKIDPRKRNGRLVELVVVIVTNKGGNEKKECKNILFPSIWMIPITVLRGYVCHFVCISIPKILLPL